MKKQFFLMAVMAAALTACEKSVLSESEYTQSGLTA